MNMKVKRICAIAGTVPVLLGLTIPLAGSAAAEPPWEMPDVSGMNLKEATDAVASVTDEKELVLQSINIKGPLQRQLNLRRWIVCWQSPKPGDPIKDDTWIGVGVVRTGSDCW